MACGSFPRFISAPRISAAGNLEIGLSAPARYARSRDGVCFAVLFSRYSKPLCTEDCVQETFRRAMEEIDRFDGRGGRSNFWAWLVTIAEIRRYARAYAKECARR